jgi:hypothetical protein
MDRRDALLEKGQKLADELAEVGDKVSMSDCDQDMTIGAFRKMIKDRDAKKRSLVAQLDEIGKEGCALEAAIGKALYAGLPGLTEAVIKVVNNHNDRATALCQVMRRVEEKVMFGDSAQALEILSTFEKDEVSVSEEVRAEFGLAMEKLSLSKKRTRKGS